MYEINFSFRGGGVLNLRLLYGEYKDMVETLKAGGGLLSLPYKDGVALVFAHAIDSIQVVEVEP